MNLLIRILFTLPIFLAIYFSSKITDYWNSFITFIRESFVEISKVVWPTHKETIHTTFIIAVVTCIVTLVLWGLDSIIIHLVSFITSLKL